MQDRENIDYFMLLSGIFIGLVVGLIFFLRMNAIQNDGAFALDDPEVQTAIADRLQPVGRVVLLGAEELAAAPPPPAPARAATVLTGPQVYNEACYLCHAAPGVGGAPVIGDAVAWRDRIAQGIELMSTHAINGFQGGTGVMPPKGGRLDLSDDEIVAAIEFMIGEVAAQ